MIITTDKVAELKPCSERFNNFKKEYPDYSGDISEFLALDKITYEDKTWVTARVMSVNQRVNWAVKCAESVKHLYEDKYPDSKVISSLFDYLKSGLDFANLTQEQKDKILQLRLATYAAAASYASTDAAYAAVYAAAAASYASTAAASYASTDAAYAAVYAAADAVADVDRKKQEQLNLSFILEVLK